MQSVQLAASEVWTTLIFFVILYLFKNELNQKKITKTLLLTCIVRLLSDAVSWAYDGEPGLFWGTVTRASNYITFVSNDLISLFFSMFVWNLVRSKDEKPPVLLRAYWIIEILTIAALTLNLHFGWFYAFDGDNLYSRGAYYRLTHIAPIASLFIVGWLLRQYREKLSKNQQFLGWTYLVLMAGATAYELLEFGLSLQTYAQTFSALMAFFVGEIEIRENLLVTQATLEEKTGNWKKKKRRSNKPCRPRSRRQKLSKSSRTSFPSPLLPRSRRIKPRQCF